MSPPMPDDMRPEPSSTPPDPGQIVSGAPAAVRSPALVAAATLAALVIIVGGISYLRAKQFTVKPLSAGLIANAQKRLTRGLDPRFSDADKDLVADPPSDAAQLVDPETIVFSYIATDDPAHTPGSRPR